MRTPTDEMDEATVRTTVWDIGAEDITMSSFPTQASEGALCEEPDPSELSQTLAHGEHPGAGPTALQRAMLSLCDALHISDWAVVRRLLPREPPQA